MATGRTATTTIAIPVYNGERFLGEAIDSVLRQTTSPTEFLVFDNASSDRSRLIAQSGVGTKSLRTSSTNRGAAWNFSRAVQESTSEYFAWLAADDRLAPDFLEQTVAALEATPAAPACLTAIRFITLAGQPVGEQHDPDLSSPASRIRLRSFVRRSRWTESYCLYRREALLASPMFGGEFGADVILTWWFLLRGPLVVLDTPLLEYRVFPSKTDEEMAESLVPGSAPQQWRKMRLWRALWRETTATDIDPRVRRAARTELVLALLGRTWIEHNVADLRMVVRHGRYRIRRVTATT